MTAFSPKSLNVPEVPISVAPGKLAIVFLPYLSHKIDRIYYTWDIPSGRAVDIHFYTVDAQIVSTRGYTDALVLSFSNGDSGPGNWSLEFFQFSPGLWRVETTTRQSKHTGQFQMDNVRGNFP